MESAPRWQLTVQRACDAAIDPSAQPQQLCSSVFDAVVSCVGNYHQPNLPEVGGQSPPAWCLGSPTCQSCLLLSSAQLPLALQGKPLAASHATWQSRQGVGGLPLAEQPISLTSLLTSRVQWATCGPLKIQAAYHAAGDLSRCWAVTVDTVEIIE